MAALIMLYGPPARAAGIDAAGASRLKGVFTAFLNKQAAQVAAQGSKLVMDGDIMVEPAEGYYAVTLPHLSTVAQDGSGLDIGMAAINAIPDDRPGRWKMTLALPTPLAWRDAKGATSMTADIGRQNFAGIWDEKLESFIKLKAEYKDIKLDSPGRELGGRLSALTIISDLTQGQNGHWSGPMSFTGAGLSVTASNGTTISIGHMEISSAVEDYALDAAGEWRDKFAPIISKLDPATNPAGLSAGDRLALYDLTAGMIGTLWDGMSLKLGIDNVAITHLVPPGAPAGTINLGHVGADLALGGFRQDKVGVQMGLNISGLDLTPPPPGFSVAPDKFNLRLAAGNIPYKAVIAYGRQNMAPPTPGEPPADLAAIMQKAGATITLQDLSFGNALYSTLANGVIKSDAQAALSIVGTARMEIAGMDVLSAELMRQAKDPAVPEDIKRSLRQAYMIVAVLQVAGRQDTGAQGKPVRSYDIEINRQGQMMLNGVDIHALFPAPGAPPPAAAGTQPYAQPLPAP